MNTRTRRTSLPFGLAAMATWTTQTIGLAGSNKGLASFSNHRSCTRLSRAPERVSPSRTGTGAALAFAWSGYVASMRTGGPISVRSVLIGLLLDQARQATTTPVFRSRAHHERDRLRELAPKLKAIQHRYEGDQQAQQRATMEFYKANQINPLAGCGRLAAGPILSQLVLASAIRNGRTAYDRLTGTIVVSDR